MYKKYNDCNNFYQALMVSDSSNEEDQKYISEHQEFPITADYVSRNIKNINGHVEVTIIEDTRKHLEYLDHSIEPFDSSNSCLRKWAQDFKYELQVTEITPYCVLPADDSLHDNILSVDYCHLQNIKEKLHGSNNNSPWGYIRELFSHMTEKEIIKWFPILQDDIKMRKMSIQKVEEYIREVYKTAYISRHGVNDVWKFLPRGLRDQRKESMPKYMTELFICLDDFVIKYGDNDFMQKLRYLLHIEDREVKSTEDFLEKTDKALIEYIAFVETNNDNPNYLMNIIREYLLDQIKNEAESLGMDFSDQNERLKYYDNFDRNNRISADSMMGIRTLLRDMASEKNGYKCDNSINFRDEATAEKLAHSIYAGVSLTKREKSYVISVRGDIENKFKELYPGSPIPNILSREPKINRNKYKDSAAINKG